MQYNSIYLPCLFIAAIAVLFLLYLGTSYL
jgi:hypothetical protein